MLGYFFALISSLFFSFYIIPRKLSKLTPINFSFFMSIGFFSSTIILYLFQPILKFHEVFSPVLFWSVLAGIIWATSFISFVSSIDEIGLFKDQSTFCSTCGGCSFFIGNYVYNQKRNV